MITGPGAAFWRAALLAGLIAGALDIAAAVLLNPQVPAQVVFQSVASGWLGSATYDGGWSTAALGLASHFAIMLVIAAVWMTLALSLPALRRLWPLAAVGGGAVVWAIMTYGVVPLSASTLPAPDARHVVIGLLTHVIAVGLPMALVSRRALGAPVR